VVDRADVISPAAEQRLENVLASYEQETGHQIVVHTTPSLEGLEIEQYAIAVADAWKIGHRGLDNGVILTVAPSEQKFRISVGYGLEGAIPDYVASQIGQSRLVPAFRRGDLEGGILAGVEAIAAAARGELVDAPRARGGDTRAPRGVSHLFWLILLLLVFMGPRGLLLLPFLGGHYGRGGGGFGGGGGGFGGGGGGFGGGGSSGSW
jgi:uncharacterized protein